MNKVKHKLNKKVNIEQLQAYEEAYGGRLTNKKKWGLIVVNGFILAYFVGLMTWNIWTAIIAFLAGCLFDYYRVLPQQVKMDYYSKSYSERNRLINSLTQVLNDKGKTVIQALQAGDDRSEGELKKDLSVLISKIIGQDNDNVKKAFAEFNKKYEDDAIFTQFFEQIETAMYEGKIDKNTFTDIKNYHNQLYAFYKDYVAARNQNKRMITTMTWIVAGLIAAICISFGLKTYTGAFPHSYVGYATTFVFLGLNSIWRAGFYKHYYDNSITTYSSKS